MAIGVDTSKWKPRKIIGTPANKFSIVLGFSIITVGMLCGLAFHFSPVSIGIRKATEVFYEEDILDAERSMMIADGMLRNRSGAKIRKMMEDQERLDRPDA